MSFRNSRRHSKSGRSTRNHYAGHKKTELCRDHLNGTCERGPECSFAHGVDELKPRVLEVGNYKTEKCDMWASRLHLPVEKRCQYGTRCHFLHDEHAWAQKGDTTVLFSESEQMYRIIRKVSGSRSRRHRRGGPCDEVRSCSAALMPQSELDKYRSFTLPLKPTLDEEKASSVIVSDLESGIHSEHSSVAPLMDEDESEYGDITTPSTSFGSPGTFSQTSSVLCDTDVESVVSTHVSSNTYSSTTSSQRSIDLQPSTVSCHLPSNVSTVTPYPDQSVYGGSLLRMTSVSQKRAQLTVEIPEPVTTIFGTPDSPTSPQVFSIGINTQQTRTQSPPTVQQTIQQPQPQAQVSAPIVQCIPQQRMPTQVVIQNSQMPMQIAHNLSSPPPATATATAYVMTYVQVGMPDGTTQILPVLSPVGSNGRPAPLTSSQSAPPSPPQAIGQFVQAVPQPQQQTVFQLPTQPIMTQPTRVCSVMVPATSSPQHISQPVHLSSPQGVQTPTILPSPVSGNESGIVA